MAKVNLTIAQRFKLMNLVQEDYITRRQSDNEYAVYAAEKLGIPTINANHVASSREALGIEASKFGATSVALESRVVLLEKRLAAVEEQLNQLHLRAQNTGFGLVHAGGPR